MPTTETDEVSALPEDLVAICLDANAMSRGRLNVDVIQDLLEVVESQELDAEVWIPEPVAWEWAEHLAAELAKARDGLQAARMQAEHAGAPHLVTGEWPDRLEVDGVVQSILESLESLDGCSVLRLNAHPGIAVAGLRDQVLLQGVGRRKSNIKTGASDSAAYRLAEDELGRRGGSLVVVSGDQDAASHFAGKPHVLLVNSVSRARAGIVAMRTGSEIAATRVRDAISLRLPALTEKELGYPQIDSQSYHLDASRRFGGRVVESNLGLRGVDSVTRVVNVEVSRSDGYATALVEGLVSVERELQVLSEMNGVIEMDVETFDGIHATLEISAESDDGINWDIVVDVAHLAAESL